MTKRVKTFGASYTVSREFARLARIDMAEASRSAVAIQLDGYATGPRGGRYRLVGPIIMKEERSFMTDTVTYHGTRLGAYQRPRRRSDHSV